MTPIFTTLEEIQRIIGNRIKISGERPLGIATTTVAPDTVLRYVLFAEAQLTAKLRTAYCFPLNLCSGETQFLLASIVNAFVVRSLYRDFYPIQQGPDGRSNIPASGITEAKELLAMILNGSILLQGEKPRDSVVESSIAGRFAPPITTQEYAEQGIISVTGIGRGDQNEQFLDADPLEEFTVDNIDW